MGPSKGGVNPTPCAYIDTGGIGVGKSPPTLENRGWGSEGGKEKSGRKGKGEREKEKTGKGRKKKRKERGKEKKRREKSKLKVFLKYSFWLGVQAR